MTDPFAAYAQQQAPAPAPAPVQQAPVAPAPAPAVAPTTPAPTPAPAVDPQFAAYQAWLASQQAAPVAPPATPAPVAPPAAPIPPVAPVAPQQAPPVPPAQFVAPPAPAATAAPMTAPGSMNPDDLFDDPAPQRPKGPRLREMYGRLLVIIPKGVEKVNRRQQDGSTVQQDRMTADVVVLDGGPMAYGGTPEKPPFNPHDKTAAIPHREVNMYVSAVGIISQCETALAKRRAGQPGMTIGRLGVGQAQQGSDRNPPWLLLPATPEDKALAARYVQALAQDLFA